MDLIRHRGGFTLMEMMVTMSIVVGISGVLVAVFRMNQQCWEVAQAHLSVSMELRRGMDEMSRELTSTQVAQVDIPADGTWYPSITFSVPEDVDGDGTVLDSSGAMEWSDSITYSLGGETEEQALREQDGELDRVIANGVTELEFKRDAATPTVVEVRISVEKVVHTKDFPHTATLSTRVRLRNN